jgi:5-oxoprolinase (ATP-hydrolysing)
VVRKVLSVQPGSLGDPAVAAIQSILGIPAGQPIPEGLVDGVRLGTTVATNALIEHRGQPVLLLINRGLADLPTIGDQHRPDYRLGGCSAIFGNTTTTLQQTDPSPRRLE